MDGPVVHWLCFCAPYGRDPPNLQGSIDPYDAPPPPLEGGVVDANPSPLVISRGRYPDDSPFFPSTIPGILLQPYLMLFDPNAWYWHGGGMLHFLSAILVLARGQGGSVYLRASHRQPGNRRRAPTQKVEPKGEATGVLTGRP